MMPRQALSTDGATVLRTEPRLDPYRDDGFRNLPIRSKASRGSCTARMMAGDLDSCKG